MYIEIYVCGENFFYLGCGGNNLCCKILILFMYFWLEFGK